MRNPPFAFVAPALLLAVTACATAVGEGRYMLIGNQAGRVVVEIDTGNGGMASCANQVAMASQSRPSGVAYRCSTVPSEDPLPYSFVAHQQTRESDGFKPSQPYRVRVADRARCAQVRDSTARGEKTVIVEDHCK
jgi:hypothetical protein